MMRMMFEEIVRLKHYIINLDAKVDDMGIKLATGAVGSGDVLIKKPFLTWESFIEFDSTLQEEDKYKNLVCLNVTKRDGKNFTYFQGLYSDQTIHPFTRSRNALLI